VQYLDDYHLIMGNNAIYQLNIVDAGVQVGANTRIKCLFDVIDKTNTSMGRRYLRERITSPLCNIDELNESYNNINIMMQNKNYQIAENHLREITDIERLDRRVCLQTAHPYELINLYLSYKEIATMINSMICYKDNPNIYPDATTITKFNEMITNIEATYVINEMKKYNMHDLMGNFFIPGIHDDIDELQAKVTNGTTFMDTFCSELLKLLDGKPIKGSTCNDSRILVRKYDRGGYYLSTTPLRIKALEAKLANIEYINVGNQKVQTSKIQYADREKPTAKIVCEDFNITSEKLVEYQTKLGQMIKDKYVQYLGACYNKYGQVMRDIAKFVTLIDFYSNAAKIADMNNYKAPKIEHTPGNGYIKATNLRHPIIERIIEHEYVPHNINIGTDLKGMLIYGLNAAGKSSLMKAVGMSLILAQAGLYVPAKEYIYSPYNAIYTRITGNDNLFKGLSSFALEMIELKSILQRAGPNTLVIGDEICRGTEHISGNTIVAASIITLAKANASFIFATHLHDISKMARIIELSNVKAYHLSVEYDDVHDTLIYDRKLKEGSGEAIYGITVAKHIIQDAGFLKLATEIKNDLMGTYDSMISGKTSNFNKDVYVYECSICHKKASKDHNDLETHHINFQKDCDDNGFVTTEDKTHIHKNAKANLLVICSACHDKLHNNEFHVDGIVMTSKGKKPKIVKPTAKQATNNGH